MERELHSDIAAVVVTYNRSKDLMICIDALLNQTKTPDEIIIVNNQSPDDTEQRLSEAGLVDLTNYKKTEFGKESTLEYPDNGKPVKITYLLKKENDGGAGGFYAGMKTAFDKGYEWILLMDDDGRPDKDEIRELFNVAGKHGFLYSNALVINRDNPSELAFNLFSTPIETAYYDSIEYLPDCGSPFNGTFINRKLIEKIGFIKKEMFIWGDEAEYTARAKEAGHPITTICSARHFHPKTGKSQNMIPFVSRWGILPPSAKRARIFYRNQCYIFTRYNQRGNLRKFATRNILGAFLNLQWKYIPGMIKAIRTGIKGDFSKNLY